MPLLDLLGFRIVIQSNRSAMAIPKPTVYVETSIVSYLTALGSRDLVQAAHQEVTRNWWDFRGDFALYACRS